MVYSVCNRCHLEIHQWRLQQQPVMHVVGCSKPCTAPQMTTPWSSWTICMSSQFTSAGRCAAADVVQLLPEHGNSTDNFMATVHLHHHLAHLLARHAATSSDVEATSKVRMCEPHNYPTVYHEGCGVVSQMQTKHVRCFVCIKLSVLLMFISL